MHINGLGPVHYSHVVRLRWQAPYALLQLHLFPSWIYYLTTFVANQAPKVLLLNMLRDWKVYHCAHRDTFCIHHVCFSVENLLAETFFGMYEGYLVLLVIS